MKILFLSGGTQEPSSRFRAHQFFPYFEALGIRCVSRTAYGDRYNAVSSIWYGPAYKTACRLKRAVQMLDAGKFDLLFLQRTAIPHTAAPEQLAAKLNSRIIFDFDDAVYLGADGLPNRRRESAFRRAVELSAHAVAGNQHLAAYADAPEKTTVIPTVVDTDRYRPRSEGRSESPLVIGWMGTAGNFPFLSEVVPAVLRVLQENQQVRFRLVSNAVYPELLGHPGVEQVPWTEDTEIRHLQDFDVGLMPLLDTPWARGKCGFKMIQYMAVGRPVIASAVGVNVDILEGSGAGHLVHNQVDWYPAITSLLADEAGRRAMGMAARARVIDRYSVGSVLEAYVNVFAKVASG